MSTHSGPSPTAPTPVVLNMHSDSGTPNRRKDLRKRLGSKYVHSVSGSPKTRHNQSESPRKKGHERKTMFKRQEKGWKRCPKGKTVLVDTRRRDQKGRSQVLRKTIYPNHCHIKTYNGSEDPEDHLKIFQAVAKMKRWAMPTCYDDLKKAFLENYLQQECIKDPVEIHNIKQREGESTEEFVQRYKLECRDVKGDGPTLIDLIP
nr:reverse transcriptase domain-containing protein [Tanacetum cinerariifolium]